MSTPHDYDDDKPVLNVLQVVALSWASTFVLLAGFAAFGFSLGSAVLLALVGGPFLTLGIVAALFLARRRFDARSRQDLSPLSAPDGPSLVAPSVTDPMQVWEEDRLLETEHAVCASSDETVSRPPHGSPEQMIRMWDIDAEEDDAVATRVGSERRHNARRSSRG